MFLFFVSELMILFFVLGKARMFMLLIVILYFKGFFFIVEVVGVF